MHMSNRTPESRSLVVYLIQVGEKAMADKTIKRRARRLRATQMINRAAKGYKHLDKAVVQEAKKHAKQAVGAAQ